MDSDKVKDTMGYLLVIIVTSVLVIVGFITAYRDEVTKWRIYDIVQNPQVTVTHNQAATQPIKETAMKEHIQLLQPYRQRIEGLFADIEGSLNQIDTGSGITQEKLLEDVTQYRKCMDDIGADLSAAVINYALQAQKVTEHVDAEKPAKN